MADEFAKPLSIIFEKSWQSSEVPVDWKRDNNTHPHPFLKGEERKTQGTTDQLVSPQCLAGSYITDKELLRKL